MLGKGTSGELPDGRGTGAASPGTSHGEPGLALYVVDINTGQTLHEFPYMRPPLYRRNDDAALGGQYLNETAVVSRISDDGAFLGVVTSYGRICK